MFKTLLKKLFMPKLIEEELDGPKRVEYNIRWFEDNKVYEWIRTGVFINFRNKMKK